MAVKDRKKKVSGKSAKSKALVPYKKLGFSSSGGEIFPQQKWKEMVATGVSGVEGYVVPGNLQMIEDPLDTEAQLAIKLVDEIGQSGTDVKALCDDYKLKREELGRLTGFSLRALAEWANAKLPSQPAQRRLKEVRRLLDALSQVIRRESIPEWLHKQNKAFDGLTPLQVIEIGEMDRLWEMVHDIASGQPT